MSDAREALAELLRPYWPESGGQADFATFERARLAAADAILAAGWTPPTVKPSVEGGAR